MSDEIRNKLWNIDLVVKEIKQIPQTYDTILQEAINDGTCQTILRRKLNNLCKIGAVCKASIPGTRFGKAIFYSFPKKYHILVEASRTGSSVYYFFNYEKISKFYIVVPKCWNLKGKDWIPRYNKKFFDGNILKWI